MGTSDQELRKQIRRVIGLDIYRATLGDANGVINEPGLPGYVRIRYAQAGQLSQPVAVRFRAVMKKAVGAAVIVGFDDDGEIAVLRPDFQAQTSVGTNPQGDNASDENVTKFIEQERLVTFVVTPVSSASDSMLLAVQPGTVIDLSTDTLTHFAGEQVDLTSFIPGGAGEWCLACLFWKANNTIEIFASTPVTSPDDLGFADINECLALRTAGSLPLWAWRLYNGQTGIAAGAPANGGDDFLDLRPLFFMLQSGGSGSPLAVTDGTTTVDPTTLLDVDPDFFDVTDMGGGQAGLTFVGDVGVTSVTATSPLASSGGATPDISIGAPITPLYLADYWRQPCRAVAVSTTNIATAPAAINGVTLASGDRVLLTAQSTGSQNGIWIFNGSGNAMTRPTDYAAGSTVWAFFNIVVLITTGSFNLGTFGGFLWRLTTTGAITIDTTTTAWSPILLGSANLLRILNTSSGFIASFDVAALSTADRNYGVPDAGGTFLVDTAIQNFSNKTSTNQFKVDGSSDQTQLVVEGHSSQATVLAAFNDSSGNNQIGIYATGTLIVNESGNDADTRFEGDTNPNLLYLDASLNAVGVGSNSIDDSAVFQVTSTTKGAISAPVMTTAQQAAISSPVEGLQVFDSDTKHLNVYDSQRYRLSGVAGWCPYALQLGASVVGPTLGISHSIAANGGSIAIPVHVLSHMLLQSVTVRNLDISTARTWGWDLYEQYLNNGNSGENTLTRVAASNANDTFTPGAASNRTVDAASAPVYLPPGIYWLVVQNRHATNAFALASTAQSSTLFGNTAQTKTTSNPNGSTLDFVAATWTAVTAIYGVKLNGRVFGQTTAF